MSTDLSQVDVHPVVTGDKVAVVGLPILQLDQHRVVLRSNDRGNIPISWQALSETLQVSWS